MLKLSVWFNIFLISTIILAAGNEIFANVADLKDSIKINKARAKQENVNIKDLTYIVIPDQERYLSPANQIKDIIKQKAGVTLDIISDKEIDKIENGNIIVTGNITSNEVIKNLYWNWYTGMTPDVLGEEGYGIQTVFNPLPLLSENNLIVIGVPNAKALEGAITDFKKILANSTDNEIKPCYNLYSSALKPFKKSYLERYSKSPGKLYGFVKLMENYLQIGDKRYFDEAMKLLYEKSTESKNSGNKISLNWNEERNYFKAVQYWDSFLHLTDFDSEQRLNIEKMFINSIDYLVNRCSGYEMLDESYLTTWNHTNIPLLGIHTISRYIKARYGYYDKLKELSDKVRYCFEGTIDNYRPQEDAVAYTLLAAEYNMYYYLMENKQYFLESGNAQRLADLVFMSMDNNGHFAGYGDTGSPYHPGSCFRGAGVLYYILRAGEFPYMAERANSLVKFKQRTPFAEQFEGVKPEKYVGVKSIPIDKGLYELCQFHSFEGEEPVPSSIPRQLTVDKLQFRSSFKPEGEYLLIDGLGRGEHQHFDTAAITCYTAMGYKFLFDADYLCKKTSDHSIMNISKGGRSNKKIPSYAGLSHSVEFKDAAFTSLFVPDYRGIDWTRNIYWEKEKFFVVIDSLRAKHKDDYLFNCTWKVLDRGLEKYDGKNLICRAPKEKSGDQAGNIKIDPIREFDEQVFHLKNTERKGYWDHRTSSHQIPSHRIHQTRKETMKEGDYISFQNIFYVERKANRGEHVNYTPYRLNERAMLIDADNNRLLMIDDGSWKKFNLKGKFVSISRENLLGVSVTSFYKNNDRILSSNVPVDIRIKNGEIKIESDKQGKCYLFDIDESFHFNKGVTTYSDISFDLPVIGEGLKPKKQDKSQDFDSELSKTYKNFEIIWQGDETDFEYSSGTSLVIDDITNDNNDEVIVTSKTGQVDAYNIKGELLWEYSCPQGVYSAAVGDLNQDGEKEVFLGTGSHSIVVIDKKGRKIRELQIPLESSGRLGKRTQDPQWITVLDVRDLTDNGKMELIIGTRTWLVQIYDNEFNRIRYFAPFEHGVKELDYSDMDNDGFEEILVADGYGSTRIIEWQGDTDSPCVRNFTTVGNVSVDWTDVNKDGLKQMLNASGGMLVSFSRPDELQTKIEKSWDPHYGYNRMWKFNNYGYAYTDIAVLRQNTQSELVLVASENGYIYCLDAVDGRQKWKKYLGSPVRCILIEDNKIFAGTEKGWVFSLDSEGQILKDAKLGGRIEKVKALSNGKICVMDTYGQVFLLK